MMGSKMTITTQELSSVIINISSIIIDSFTKLFLQCSKKKKKKAKEQQQNKTKKAENIILLPYKSLVQMH